MNSSRKSHETRERDLRIAIGHIRAGRSREAKLTIASVAREAGVSTALIHNYHPKIAKEIRELNGTTASERLKARGDALAIAIEKKNTLQREVKALRNDLAKIASINENLMAEVRTLRQQIGGGASIVRLPLDKQ